MGNRCDGSFIRRIVAVATLVIAGTLSGLVPSSGADTISEIITGSVSPAPRIERQADNVNLQGSLAFHDAVQKLSAKEYAEAYALARNFESTVERRAVQWAAIYYGRGEVDHGSVIRFASDAPHYGSASLFRTRVEQALVDVEVSSADIVSLLGGQMPNTLEGQLRLAKAYITTGETDRGARIIKQIWAEEFLDADYEKRILAEYPGVLTREDHWRRAVHLLMHDRARGTERILDRLSGAQKSLARARIAVSRGSSGARALFDRVDPSLRDHPLFHFSRGQEARKRGDLSAAVTFLDQAKGNFPDAAEFWYERRLIARRALAKGNSKTAYLAAAGYDEGPEGRVVDANFHAGWIAFSYLDDAKTARGHFLKMRALSTLPGSITKSNFWLGRALTALGEVNAAKKAFSLAADYHTLFYGQLSRFELGIRGSGLRTLPAWRPSTAGFESRELVRAVKLLAANGNPGLAEPLLKWLAQSSLKEPGELLLGARLAQNINAHNLAIIIADIADKRGAALDPFSFPKDGLPANIKLAKMDRAAIYAVARQESRFDVDAVSRSGARGLMQLMPATAKETARKVGVAYSVDRLTSDASYNALLGSTYLAAQLDRFDGSLVLAAAAYNAGGGNSNKWIRTFGDPRLAQIDPISWIEAIPFAETRKYVQRVMANYMIYRVRLDDTKMTIAEALRRIPH